MAWYKCIGSGDKIIERTLRQQFVYNESELSCITTSSSDYGGSWASWRAFTDGTSGSCWIAGATDSWWKVEFPSAVNIEEIKYVNLDSNRFHPIDEIYISNDGTNFTEVTPIYSVAGEVILPQGIVGKYWRFNFYGYSDSGQYPLLSKLELWGYDTVLPSVPQIIPVDNYHGSNMTVPHEYTVLEDGLYLIVSANGHSGDRSITLPQGRTAIINQNVDTGSSSNTSGALFVVSYLQSGDVVSIITGHYGNWTENGCMVFLLKNIALTTVYDTDSINDNSLTYTLPSNDNYYLSLGICMGKGIEYFYDSITDIVAPLLKLNMLIGQNTEIVVYLNTGNLTPQLDMYGYDGGGVYYCIINASLQ